MKLALWLNFYIEASENLLTKIYYLMVRLTVVIDLGWTPGETYYTWISSSTLMSIEYKQH